jgi:hypothetical protein
VVTRGVKETTAVEDLAVDPVTLTWIAADRVLMRSAPDVSCAASCSVCTPADIEGRLAVHGKAPSADVLPHEAFARTCGTLSTNPRY